MPDSKKKKIYLQNSSGAQKLTFPSIFLSSGPGITPQKMTVNTTPNTWVELAVGSSYFIFVGDYANPLPPGPDIKLSFTIENDGTVTVTGMSQDFLSVATEQDRTILTLRGIPITIRFPPPQVKMRALKELGVLQGTDEQAVTLLPGRYALAASAAASAACLAEFTVKPDGTIEYDSALEGVLHSEGKILTINGVLVELDAKALSPFHVLRLTLDHHNFELAQFLSSEKPSLRLLPATYKLSPLYGDQGWIYTQIDLFCGFTVTPQGQVLAPQDPLLTIQGNTVLVLGSAVTIDAQVLSGRTFSFAQVQQSKNVNAAIKVFDGSTTQELTLLPAYYQFATAKGDSSGVHDLFGFRIDRQGNFSYEIETEALSGRGSRSLRIRGYAITIDARRLANQKVRPRGAIADPVPTREPLKLQIVGRAENVLELDGGGSFTFWVDERTGTVHLKQTSMTKELSWELLIDGWGTSTLVVRGAELALDLTRLAPFADDFVLRTPPTPNKQGTLLGSGAFATAQERAVQIAPGSYVLHVAKCKPGSNAGSTSLPPTLSLPFTVGYDGKISGLPASPALLVENPAVTKSRIQVGVSKSSPNQDWPIAGSDKLPPGSYTATLVVTSNQNWISERVVRRVEVKGYAE